VNKGILYLIPTHLGIPDSMTAEQADQVLPASVRSCISQIDHYIVEQEKTARRFIKLMIPEKPQPSLKIELLNKHTDPSEHRQMLQPCLDGKNVGLMSEAGCPGIADPGAAIVKLAHEMGIRVVPLVGPSSIVLAMMASGMNGQNFAFVGYLPIDKNERKHALKSLEKLSFERNQSQIFIETPYRNNKMTEEIFNTLQPGTLVCVAADITLPTEFIKTMRVSDWKKQKADLHNRPCIFIVHKY
jgi:16S rRNA (cytidine1402-2'-O)-methyltransferase